MALCLRVIDRKVGSEERENVSEKICHYSEGIRGVCLEGMKTPANILVFKYLNIYEGE